jgi:predicted nucleic acid-binding protein
MAIALIDTNVVVYAYDRGEHAKQRLAIALLEELQFSNSGRLSTQVLAEFFTATTHGPKPILTVPQAAELVDALASAWPILMVTDSVVKAAARAVRDRRLNYWDAQLWATALLNQVPLIFSEDFASGASLEGVRLVNPFAPEFRLCDWQ